MKKSNLTKLNNIYVKKELIEAPAKVENAGFKFISKFLKPKKIFIVSLFLIMAGYVSGCAESSINSVTSDSPYVNIDKPKLVLSGEHFGGGYTVEDTDKRTFFAGGTLTNYGNKSAYSANIRVRILDVNGSVCDDHIINLKDIDPKKSVVFDEKYEVVKNYSGFEAILTYQTEDRAQSVVLNQSTSNINNLEKNTY